VIPLVSTPFDIKITATDGWAGYNSTPVTVRPDNIVTGILVKEELPLYFYPNPSRSIRTHMEMTWQLSGSSDGKYFIFFLR
jgi:hypothetical protein